MDELECKVCGCLGFTPDGCDPTHLCNNCAHEMLDDIALSGVVLDDKRMSYVVVQVERSVWEALKSSR